MQYTAHGGMKIDVGSMSKVEFMYLRTNSLWIVIFVCLLSRQSNGATIQTGFEASGDWKSFDSQQSLTETTFARTTSQFSKSDQSYAATEIAETTTFEPTTQNYTSPSVYYQNHQNQSNNNNGSIDIIPIVGTICGVIGLLVGIIISALVCLYINKRKISHPNSIAKNPEEKTFERLDFNLTLPRAQQSMNTADSGSLSDASSPKKLPLDSNYLHFDEPTPFGIDVYERDSLSNNFVPNHGACLKKETIDDSYATEKSHYMRDKTVVGDYENEFSNEELRPYFSKYDDEAKAPSYRQCPYHKCSKHLPSYSALLHQDSSDQSTISRKSSNITEVCPRRCSNCTSKTELPDSDGSNSSTCDGSISITSSLAREKPCLREGHIVSYRSSYFSDTNTISTRVPSSVETQARVHDSEYEDHVEDRKSVSSSDIFINSRENRIFEPPKKEETKADEASQDAQSSLSYFDLQLPPTTFGSPRQSVVSDILSEQENQDNGSFHKNSATFPFSDEEFTITSRIFDNTVDL